MNVSSVCRQLPFVLTGDGKVIVGLGTAGHVDVAKARCFIDCLARPDTGIDVVGTAAFWHQVQRDLGKLLAGATLQEQHLVVVRNNQQLAQVLLSLLGDGNKLVAAMAHFHD